MSISKVKTTTIKGGVEYAKVADRITEFRANNPRSRISVSHTYDKDGNLTHTARIWKDKLEYFKLISAGIDAEVIRETCDADGSSFMPAARVKSEKGFEKNESIAIGRALAILGYSVKGEVASSEEMEEFEDFKRQKVEDLKFEAVQKIGEAKTMKELQEAWTSLTKEQQLDKDVQARKNARKEELANEGA